MKSAVMTALAMVISGFSFGQEDPYANMVENGSFEEILGKLKREGGITAAVGWMSPTLTPADLFSSKAPEIIGTPSNSFGYEDPHDGNNYVGLRSFSYGDKEPRNYVSTKLVLPLRKNAKYCVKFYTSLAESSKYASNNLGVSFSKKQYNIDEDRSIMAVTNILHKDNPVFNGQFGWDEVCGIYIAEGGERYLTIGNFTANGETKNERLKKPKDFTGAQIISAYYYVDEVSVLMIDDESECVCQIDASEIKTHITYEEAPINPEGLKPEQVAQFTSCYFAYGDAALTESDYGHLNNIVKIMTENTGTLKISAHLDVEEVEDGDVATIGDERAQNAKDYLVSKGVDGSRITTENKMATEQKDQSGTEYGHAKNRRLTFVYTP
jgi:hypothetical protein